MNPGGTGINASGPIAWMVRNPIAANLAMIILLAGGVWTALTMQKEVQPRYELDYVDVSVSYPGAAPAEVEEGILLPVEEAVRGVQGIKELTSTAREGSGSISLELVTGVNRMKVYQDVDQAVSQIRTFPDDAEEPEVRLRSCSAMSWRSASTAASTPGRCASSVSGFATSCSASRTSRRSRWATCPAT